MTSRKVPPAWREGDDGCRPYAGSFARALDGGTLAEGPPAAWAGPAGKRRAPCTGDALAFIYIGKD